jgi:hypothetical protein
VCLGQQPRHPRRRGRGSEQLVQRFGHDVELLDRHRRRRGVELGGHGRRRRHRRRCFEQRGGDGRRGVGQLVGFELDRRGRQHPGDGGTVGAQMFTCPYAKNIDPANVTGEFAIFMGGTKADTYLQIGFAPAAGSVAPGGNTGIVEAIITDTDFITFNQSNDYSFNPNDLTSMDSMTVTLYHNGTLVWGLEP